MRAAGCERSLSLLGRETIGVQSRSATDLLIHFLALEPLQDPVPCYHAFWPTGLSGMTREATLGIFAQSDPKHRRAPFNMLNVSWPY